MGDPILGSLACSMWDNVHWMEGIVNGNVNYLTSQDGTKLNNSQFPFCSKMEMNSYLDATSASAFRIPRH